MTHENAGAYSWEVCSNGCSRSHQPPAGIVKKSQTNVKHGGDTVQRHKDAHQDQDALGSSRFGGGS